MLAVLVSPCGWRERRERTRRKTESGKISLEDGRKEGGFAMSWEDPYYTEPWETLTNPALETIRSDTFIN